MTTTEKLVTKSVTVEAEMWRLLEDAAWRQRISTSELLRRLIRQWAPEISKIGTVG